MTSRVELSDGSVWEYRPEENASHPWFSVVGGNPSPYGASIPVLEDWTAADHRAVADIMAPPSP